MTALAGDRNTARTIGEIGSCGVAATEKIYKGGMVETDANGYAIAAAGSAASTFAGVARDTVDNTSGANGAETAEILRTGTYKYAASGMSQANVGDDLYVVDDQTVGLGIAAQPVNVTGVVLSRLATTRGAASVALAFTFSGTTLAFGGGTAIDISGGGEFVLTGTDGNQILATVTAGSIPGSDKSDNIFLRRVRAGVCDAVDSATVVWVDINGAVSR